MNQAPDFPSVATIEQNPLKVNPPIKNLKVFEAKGCRHAILCDKNLPKKSAILLGKINEHSTGGTLTGCNVWLDVSSALVLLIFGRRGTGKSYDLGILAEGLSSQYNDITLGNDKHAVIIFDPLSQFWTLSEEPSENIADDTSQIQELTKWGIKKRGLKNIKVFIPRSSKKRQPSFIEFSINVSDLNAADWCGLFQVDMYSELRGQLLSEAYRKVTKDGYNANGRNVTAKKNYMINDLINCISEDDEINSPDRGYDNRTCRSVLVRLRELTEMPLFSGTNEIDIRSIFSNNFISVFLLRELDEATVSLIVAIVTRKIFQVRGMAWENEEHTKRLRVRADSLKNIDKKASEEALKQAEELEKEVKEHGVPKGWIIFDEAQLLCPSQGYTASKDVLIDIAKRGRVFGLSIAAATQQPSALSNKFISQRDIIITHHLGIKGDIDQALSQMNPNFPESIKEANNDITDDIPYRILGSLKSGEAIVSSDELNRNFLIKMRPRVSVHGGKEPIYL